MPSGVCVFVQVQKRRRKKREEMIYINVTQVDNPKGRSLRLQEAHTYQVVCVRWYEGEYKVGGGGGGEEGGNDICT